MTTTIDARWRPRWTTRIDPLTLVLIAVPVVLVLAAGWAHRWMTDDGFINVRVVQQIFDGHGPVFNAGERVEVASSTIWLFLLVAAHALTFWMPIEWAAVRLGLATTAAGVLLAQVAAARTIGTRRVMPFGILAVIALPPVWDFTTSGLENGLTFLWIAGCQYCLVSAVRSTSTRVRFATAALIGLGPLVRPDLLVMTVVFLAFLIALTWPWRPHDLLRLGIAAFAVPALYELFRMAYYGALVPNTAFAKEAGTSSWRQGFIYLRDFVRPYQLWLAFALLAGVFVAVAIRVPTRARLLMAAPVVAGLVYGFFVVRGGGDHMHGRLLLPALFAVALPIAAVPRRLVLLVPLALLLTWSIIPIWSGGPPYEDVGPEKIANERTVWVRSAHDHPVTIADFEKYIVYLKTYAAPAKRLAAVGPAVILIANLASNKNTILPLAPAAPQRVVLRFGAVGMVSVSSGTDVYIADGLSLADPVGARMEIKERGRPGHEKHVPASMHVARFADPDVPVPDEAGGQANVDAARRALQCPEVRRLLQRANHALTPGQIARNIWGALADHDVRIDADPAVVAAECR